MPASTAGTTIGATITAAVPISRFVVHDPPKLLVTLSHNAMLTLLHTKMSEVWLKKHLGNGKHGKLFHSDITPSRKITKLSHHFLTLTSDKFGRFTTIIH
jgi:hypothetical protein